jgi:RNA polymerase sigma factor (sigma-70 family)
MKTAPMAATLDDLLQHAPWARRLARTLVGDADDAEDIVQDSLIASLRAGPDAGTPLLPWVRQVVRNRAINHRRDQLRRRRRDDAATAEPIQGEIEDPETALGRLEAHRMLADLVAQLPEPLRQTIICRFYDGLDSAAIGLAMGVPAGTARWRLKKAVTLLREELDRRNEGDRARWMRALLPLVGVPRPPSLAPRPRWALPVVAAAALVAAFGVLLITVSPFGSRRRAGVALESALPGRRGAVAANANGRAAGLPPEGPGPLAAAVPMDLPTCLAALAAVRKETAAIAPTYHTRGEPDRVFAEGAPNPAARRQLLALLESLFASPATAGFAHEVECHTWNCQLRVVIPEDADMNAWGLPFQHDAQVAAFTGGNMAFFAGRPTRDPISGKALVEQIAFVHLARPGPDPTDPAPLPTSAVVCDPLLRAERTHLASMQASLARTRSPIETYQKDPPNPALSATLTKIIDRVLGPDVRRFDLRLDCRGQACRLQTNPAGDQEEDSWVQRLLADAEFDRHTAGGPGAMGGAYYFIAGDPNRPQGIDFLRTHVRAFKAGPALAACAAAHPGVTGELEMRLNVPENAEAGAITADYGGTLADTPLGQCVQSAFARDVLAVRPPDHVTGVMTFASFKFPLPK